MFFFTFILSSIGALWTFWRPTNCPLTLQSRYNDRQARLHRSHQALPWHLPEYTLRSMKSTISTSRFVYITVVNRKSAFCRVGVDHELCFLWKGMLCQRNAQRNCFVLRLTYLTGIEVTFQIGISCYSGDGKEGCPPFVILRSGSRPCNSSQ